MNANPQTKVTGEQMRWIVGVFMLCGRIEDERAQTIREWLGEIASRCRNSVGGWSIPRADYTKLTGAELQITIRKEDRQYDELRFGQDYEIALPEVPYDVLAESVSDPYDLGSRIVPIVQDLLKEWGMAATQ